MDLCLGLVYSEYFVLSIAPFSWANKLVGLFVHPPFLMSTAILNSGWGHWARTVLSLLVSSFVPVASEPFPQDQLNIYINPGSASLALLESCRKHVIHLNKFVYWWILNLTSFHENKGKVWNDTRVLKHRNCTSGNSFSCGYWRIKRCSPLGASVRGTHFKFWQIHESCCLLDLLPHRGSAEGPVHRLQFWELLCLGADPTASKISKICKIFLRYICVSVYVCL